MGGVQRLADLTRTINLRTIGHWDFVIGNKANVVGATLRENIRREIRSPNRLAGQGLVVVAAKSAAFYVGLNLHNSSFLVLFVE